MSLIGIFPIYLFPSLPNRPLRLFRLLANMVWNLGQFALVSQNRR